MKKYWLYRLGIFVVRILPLKFVYWLGLRVSDHCWRKDDRGRNAVISNISQVFKARGVAASEETLHSLSRKTYQYFGKYCVDFFRYSRLSRKYVERHVSIEHREYLEQTYREGKGVILVTAHYGNWELGGGVLAALGYPINAVALPQRLEKINRIYQNQRESRGLRIVPLGRSAIGLVHCLRRGELVALLADRDFTTHGIEVTFFGKLARMPRGAAWLSQKTGAPIIPSFLSRLPDDTFLHRFYPPIRPQPADTAELIQGRICSALEKEIGENPFQWFIFEDFWTPTPTPAV